MKLTIYRKNMKSTWGNVSSLPHKNTRKILRVHIHNIMKLTLNQEKRNEIDMGQCQRNWLVHFSLFRAPSLPHKMPEDYMNPNPYYNETYIESIEKIHEIDMGQYQINIVHFNLYRASKTMHLP